MPHFRARPIEVEACQWQQSGDHPAVGYFRHPEIAGWKKCQDCQWSYDSHGWIDSGDEGHKVCPGDWIITEVGGTYQPCKPGLFVLTYELAVTPEPLPATDRARLEQAAVRALVRNSAVPEWLQLPSLGRDMTPIAELVVDAVEPVVTQLVAERALCVSAGVR